MTLVSGTRSAGQRERCGQKNCKTLALSVVVHVCRYADVLHTYTCAVTECSFVCTFGSSYRVPETNCVHPFTSSLFSQQFEAYTLSERMPGKGGRNSEDEQEQGKASQQLALSAFGGCNEGTTRWSVKLDLPRVRCALGECGGAGKSSTARDRKRSLSNSPSRLPMEENASL